MARKSKRSPNPGRIEDAKTKHREDQRQRRADGLCISCPRAAANGHIRCAEHHALNTQDSLDKAQERREKGICVSCPNRAIEGRSRCQTCQDKRRTKPRVPLEV